MQRQPLSDDDLEEQMNNLSIKSQISLSILQINVSLSSEYLGPALDLLSCSPRDVHLNSSKIVPIYK